MCRWAISYKFHSIVLSLLSPPILLLSVSSHFSLDKGVSIQNGCLQQGQFIGNLQMWSSASSSVMFGLFRLRRLCAFLPTAKYQLIIQSLWKMWQQSGFDDHVTSSPASKWHKQIAQPFETRRRLVLELFVCSVFSFWFVTASPERGTLTVWFLSNSNASKSTESSLSARLCRTGEDVSVFVTSVLWEPLISCDPPSDKIKVASDWFSTSCSVSFLSSPIDFFDASSFSSSFSSPVCISEFVSAFHRKRIQYKGKMENLNFWVFTSVNPNLKISRYTIVSAYLRSYNSPLERKGIAVGFRLPVYA